jgi:predicted CopG family antitoxin
MGFKTLTIKENVYNKLLLMKRKEESFSDFFERMSTTNIEVLKKMRATQTYEDKEDILQEINTKRKEKRFR